MRYAILSDVHGRQEKLQAVLADAQAQGAGLIMCLGDVGSDECVALLRRVRALAVFGNYEVSGWQRLTPENREWVKRLPPLIEGNGFLGVHAVPWWPEGLTTIEEFAAWRQSGGHSWSALFPYLDEDEDYLWQALAVLETYGKPVLFHGHTHRQTVWQCGSEGRLRRVASPSFQVKAGHAYLVGVGSVGVPDDGTWSAYGLYDDESGRIELRRLVRPGGMEHDR